MSIPVYGEHPAGYTGPVRLTTEQKALVQPMADRWTRTLIAQARDDSDPEIQAAAQRLLARDGINW